MESKVISWEPSRKPRQIPMGSVRSGTIIIDGQSFPAAAGLVRQALLFNIEQMSMTLSSMNFEGDPADERAVYVEKRRRALYILEILDGVIWDQGVATHPTVPVNINSHELGGDDCTVLRQSLLLSKRYKVREKMNIDLIDQMVSLMIDGVPEEDVKSA